TGSAVPAALDGTTMSLHRNVLKAAVLSLSFGVFLPTQLISAAESIQRDIVPATQQAPASFRNPRRTAIVEVVERVRASVVNIHSERSARGPSPEELLATAPSQNRVNGMGTGIIIDP